MDWMKGYQEHLKGTGTDCSQTVINFSLLKNVTYTGHLATSVLLTRILTVALLTRILTVAQAIGNLETSIILLEDTES